MFKKIPGNSDFSINLKCEVRDIHGKEVKLPSGSSNRVLIDILGKTKEMSLRKLSLLAWYEVGSMPFFEKNLENIIFHPIEKNALRLRSGYLMSFKKPIIYREGFRLIPNYVRYAISKDGVVLDTFKNTIITERRFDKGLDSESSYESVYIYNPDRNANRDTRLHRLLALAWIPNDDFINRPFINHKDGKRTNNEISNLEWCNLSENVQHALRTGLNGTQVKMKTRDSQTGEVRIHNSVTDLGRFLGINLINAARFDRVLPGYRYNGRYEIKRFSDNTPWFYEQGAVIDHGASKAIYTITVVNTVTGESSVYYNTNRFRKDHGIVSTTGGIDRAIERISKTHPELRISYKINSLRGPYRLLDIKTDRVTILQSIPAVSEITGINRNVLRYDLTIGSKYIYSGRWIVSLINKEMVFDKDDYVPKPENKKRVLVKNHETGIETEVNSVREAGALTGITRRTIVKYLKTGNIFKGYSFRPLAQ